MIKKIKNTAGFTLIEVLVAMTIFAVMMVAVSDTAVTFYNGQKRQTYLNELYEESRFLMERIVYEARVGTVDYEEYYSRKPVGENGLGALKYGANPMMYEENFYLFYGRNDPSNVHEGYFSTMRDTDVINDDETLSALTDHEQDELYLISSDGSEKTILKLIKNDIDDDQNGVVDEGIPKDTGQEYIGVSKMVAADFDENGLNDSWTAHADYTGGYVDEASCNLDSNAEWYEDLADPNDSFCLKFYSITPPSLEVKDFQIFISPKEDPRKAFAEEGKNIQIQPHVLIVLETALNTSRNAMIDGIDPTLSLQTTVSSRIYNNVLFDQ